ncbi:MAG: portal protein, partial [Acetobacteraceae bacterium]
MSPEEILLREGRARDARRGLEPVWQEAYDHVLARMPGHGGETLYDATAADAAEQLAASLIAELCPPWSRWFGLAPARRADEAGPDLARPLDDAAETLQAHLDRSNFALELHQCFLDLVVAGTGVLAVEEAPIGEVSALTFHAVPLREAVLEEGPAGRLETIYRTLRLTAEETARRFPFADALPGAADPDRRFRIVECVTPDASGGVAYAAVLDAEGEGPPARLAAARLADSPFIAFRWLKAPGETYGRGPVVKALPDIRTANKVVELILKNASIAATGIWLAEDDGVLNPA